MTDEERWRLFPIILSEHKPVWKNYYLDEKLVIERIIGSQNIVSISHIGSTAVPGLISKPTIDILVQIKNSTDIKKMILDMQKAGVVLPI